MAISWDGKAGRAAAPRSAEGSNPYSLGRGGEGVRDPIWGRSGRSGPRRCRPSLGRPQQCTPGWCCNEFSRPLRCLPDRGRPPICHLPSNNSRGRRPPSRQPLERRSHRRPGRGGRAQSLQDGKRTFSSHRPPEGRPGRGMGDSGRPNWGDAGGQYVGRFLTRPNLSSRSRPHRGLRRRGGPSECDPQRCHRAGRKPQRRQPAGRVACRSRPKPF